MLRTTLMMIVGSSLTILSFVCFITGIMIYKGETNINPTEEFDFLLLYWTIGYIFGIPGFALVMEAFDRYKQH